MNTAVPTASHPNPGMQVTTFENPMGIDGFEFVEFAAPAGRGPTPRGSRDGRQAYPRGTSPIVSTDPSRTHRLVGAHGLKMRRIPSEL